MLTLLLMLLWKLKEIKCCCTNKQRVSADVSAIVTSESTSTGAGNGAGMPAWALDGLLDSSKTQ
jgi:hypothetical protein